MKKKVYTSPITIIAVLLIASANTMLYLSNMIRLSGTHDWVSIIIGLTAAVVSIVAMIMSVANVMIQKRKRIVADELTQEIVNRCAVICFMLFVILVFAMFLVFQIIILFNEDSGKSLNELIGTGVVLSAVALIQAACSFLFLVLFYRLSKAGERDEKQN